jgi:hypothetical protein
MVLAMPWTRCLSITSATDPFGNSDSLARTYFARLPKTHAVILKEDIAVAGFAKVVIDVELALGDDYAELWGNAVVLDDLNAIEPVLPAGAALEICQPTKMSSQRSRSP